MDDGDYAKEFQTRYESSSLAAQLSRPDHGPGEQQLMINDAICCIDCMDPIPIARLRIVPGAVRCVDCKETWERRR